MTGFFTSGGALKKVNVMERVKLITLPQLNDCGGDIKKRWFVYYSVKDPRTGKMKRFKYYKGLNKGSREKLGGSELNVLSSRV